MTALLFHFVALSTSRLMSNTPVECFINVSYTSCIKLEERMQIILLFAVS